LKRVLFIAVLVIVAAACQSSDEIDESSDLRIVSLSPTATETLFAIGAGDNVVAVDDQSNYPAEAPITDLTGFTPNIEAIAALDPDFVVIMFDPEGQTVTALETIGIKVLVQPAAIDLDDAYAQIEELGLESGYVVGALTLVESMQVDIAEIVAATESNGSTYYFELDNTFYSVTSETFIGSLYTLLGLVNIADAVDIEGFGYPQLSPEHIIIEDPNYIFLADTKCCGESIQTVELRPGWDTLSAVQSGLVIELDDDIASRWGPRIVDFLEVVSSAVAVSVDT